MSYFEDHLLAGERIVHRTSVHPVRWLRPLGGVFLAAALLIAGAAFRFEGLWIYAGFGGAFGLLSALGCLLKGVGDFLTCELAVTSKRVLIKIGFLRRRSLELNLNKVEGIVVEQSLLGRLFGYGPIVVTGTGGTPEGFGDVREPLAFRRAVQEEIGKAHAQAPLLMPDQAFPQWLIEGLRK